MFATIDHPEGRLAPSAARPVLSSVRDRLAAGLAACGEAVRSAADATLTDGGEAAVHDLRVALRHAIVNSRIVAKADRGPEMQACRRRFRQVRRAAGPLRDLDLALAWVARRAADGDIDPALAQCWRDALLDRRTAAERRLRRLVGSKGFCDALTSWCEIFGGARQSPFNAVRPDIEEWLRRAWCRIGRRASAFRAATGFRDLHRLRKELRTLRYLLEFLAADEFAPTRESILAELRRAQDKLGDVCDLRQRRRLLRAVLGRLAEVGRSRSVSRLARRLRRQEDRARRACREALRRIGKQPFPDDGSWLAAPSRRVRHCATVA